MLLQPHAFCVPADKQSAVSITGNEHHEEGQKGCGKMQMFCQTSTAQTKYENIVN